MRSTIVVILIVLGGGAASMVVGHRSADEAAAAKQNEARRPPIEVTAAPVAFRPVQESIEVVGTLQGYETVTVAAEVDGRVSRVLHDMSDRVEPGEPLLEIDPVDYQLALDRAQKALEVDLSRLGLARPDPNYDVKKLPAVRQAQARLENAAAQLKRIELLLGERAVSRQQYEDAVAANTVAEAEYANQLLLGQSALVTLQDRQLAIDLATEKLNHTRVTAPVPSQPLPISGKQASYAITARLVAEGTYVRAGTELYRLVIDRPLKLTAAVPERYAETIRVGQKVSLQATAYGGDIRAAVWRINPAVDPATRTFEVEVLVANPESALKAGGFARAEILTRENPHVPTVPLEALVTYAGTTKIFVVDGEHARAVPVQLGRQTADWAEIVSPALDEKSAVICSGLAVLVDGSPIALRSAASSTEDLSGAARQLAAEPREAAR